MSVPCYFFYPLIFLVMTQLQIHIVECMNTRMYENKLFYSEGFVLLF